MPSLSRREGVPCLWTHFLSGLVLKTSHLPLPPSHHPLWCLSAPLHAAGFLFQLSFFHTKQFCRSPGGRAPCSRFYPRSPPLRFLPEGEFFLRCAPGLAPLPPPRLKSTPFPAFPPRFCVFATPTRPPPAVESRRFPS